MADCSTSSVDDDQESVQRSHVDPIPSKYANEIIGNNKNFEPEISNELGIRNVLGRKRRE